MEECDNYNSVELDAEKVGTVWWSSGKEENRIGLWEVQKRISESLGLVCRLAGLFYPPGDGMGRRLFREFLVVGLRVRIWGR
ncbi:hypothetical protein DEO72_LG10g2194 [Vigna unguiculata]|nr:hypothetical protein DEO72_LG1g1623 [Vigna unguiculata]QCD81942.1 hypothetical protein DEO72_LG2g2274 [Vigna unguiculata]QCE10627.1 hypothetical protein DEO72_LG10g1858 [Vigna unguiculata]QCE10961.1 hypothetical protein DEO72_LG10g2194 [Vigna unguiculata]